MTERPSLRSLAEKYGCDKLHSHSYVPVYEELFRDMNVRRLLEIGIGYEDLMKPFVPHYHHGASLYMWSEYFPDAWITACDIREETLIQDPANRIKSHLLDQSDDLDLEYFARYTEPPFDVVIDDGSHETAHQILTASWLLPRLNYGGVYVIEDVREPEKVLEELTSISMPPTAPVFVYICRFNKRPDDCLVVARKAALKENL